MPEAAKLSWRLAVCSQKIFEKVLMRGPLDQAGLVLGGDDDGA
jgi:hypothetical protein